MQVVMASRGPQDLLREYVSLDRKRAGTGVTPIEYQRWLDLGQRLDQLFPERPRREARAKTVMLVGVEREAQLHDAVMMNIHPIGLFIDTPFAPEPGTRLDLRVCVKETGAVLESPVVVVSNGVGPGFSTEVLGMGVRFTQERCSLRTLLDTLCGTAAQTQSGDPESRR